MIKIVVLLILVITTSCKSTDVERVTLTNALLGVVFDYKSCPILNAKLIFNSIDGVEVATISTDIDGKFYIPEIEFTDYFVTISSKDIPETTIKASHYDIQNVLIIRVNTYNDLLGNIEESLKKNDLLSAETLIERLSSYYVDDTYFNYLKSIFYIKNSLYEAAESTLLSLKHNNNPYIYLLLADLYQYSLNNNKVALFYINKYIELENNENMNKRIKELQDVD